MPRTASPPPPWIASRIAARLAACLAAAALSVGALPARGHAQAADTAPGASAAPVPAVESAGRVLIDLTTLVRRYGWSASDAGATLTIRTGAGILTVFDKSPDALWQSAGDGGPSVVPLSTPPLATANGWFVPEDLLLVLGVERVGAAVEVPEGLAPLAFPPPTRAGDGYELAPLGAGTVGLRFFGAGAAGPDTVSLLLSDLTLLALAVPEHRELLDAVLVDGPMASSQPLLVTVTAVAPTAWEASLVFEQGDVRFEARHPFRFQLVTGSAERVEPDAPVLAVVLLPERFSLEAPLRVRWGDLTADVTFRPGR